MDDNGTSYFGITFGTALALEGAIVTLLVALKVVASADDGTLAAVVGILNILLGVVYHVQTVQAKRKALGLK